MDIANLFYDQGLSQYALDFMQSSSMNSFNQLENAQRIQSIMNIPYYSRQIIAHTLERGSTERTKLKASFNDETRNLRSIQIKRKSSRSFKQHIQLEELANLLLSSYFITERFEKHSHHLSRRSIPSGGALYPVDLHYINLNTIGLPRGSYVYNPHEESLELLQPSPGKRLFIRQLRKCFPEAVLGSWNLDLISGIIVFGGVLNRCSCKYGDRGLRFVLMDVGALCQNLHLSAASNGLACCAIGGYLDQALNDFLGFQQPNESALLSMFIGK
ncbi:MAG: SagB family peptide dehydrogenase [Bacteroidales bacterium]|jgi:SagB-type dehydrogenase family enzyme|nr:SagB family peptide dehydrogenase [Bacteroidales bacterium]MDD2617465.1 SagB family peptide dehydrogenase [Bacteroidales bacterium]MDD4640183.1 SagB family peptide dehydrogenase [Bacteroidales bacterium]